MSDCDGLISNCIISNNSGWGIETPFDGYSSGWGGGAASCDGAITNCIISGNTADKGAGLAHCNGLVVNCTIIDNTTRVDFWDQSFGAGLYYCDGSIINCILWGNTANNAGDQLYYSSTPTYSCIQDWTGSGMGNITSNPLFADASNKDYHLKSEYGRWDAMSDPNDPVWVYDAVTSPCIDAGDPSSNWMGELWPHGGRINMGAYGGTPQASMSPNPIGNIADLDHNDAVDVVDFMLFCEDYLLEEFLLDTDLNRNGKVDIVDFALFAHQWLWSEP